mgnify:CR=1 FL=1
MTKSEALKLAQDHIGKSDVILVTSDGSVFFKEHKGAADFHARDKKLELFEFSGEDLKAEPKAEPKPSKKTKE